MAKSKRSKISVICPQGKTFLYNIYWRDPFGKAILLDGYSARSEIRTVFPTLGISEAGDDDVIYSMTTDNGRIEIDEDAGKISINIPAEDTANFPVGVYFWELELIDPEGYVPYIMDVSKFKVVTEVTLND